MCRVPGVASETLADPLCVCSLLDTLKLLEGMDSRVKHEVRVPRRSSTGSLPWLSLL